MRMNSSYTCMRLQVFVTAFERFWLQLFRQEAKRRLSTEVATLSAGELAAVDLVERLEKAHSQAELTESHAVSVILDCICSDW